MSNAEPLLVQAIYSFKGKNNDELCFKKGDVIVVSQKEDGGWWEGTFNEKTGWFPSNYVQEYKPSPDAVSSPVKFSSPVKLASEIILNMKANRALVVKDIIESERAFVTELQTLIHNFLVPIEKSEVLSKDQFTQLTSNLPDILSLHEALLAALEASALEQRLGRVFLHYAQDMKRVHYAYAHAHPRAACILDAFKDELTKVMEASGASSPGLLVLTTGLSKPLRRLDKYTGLLQELERHVDEAHADRGDSQRCVSVYRDVQTACAMVRRQKELELEVLTGGVRGWEGEELSHLGEVLHMGSVAVGPSHQDRYFVLFSSTLLMLSVSSRMSAFIYEGKLPLTGIVVSKVDDSEAFKNAFQISGPLIETIIAICQTRDDLNLWIEKLSAQIRANRTPGGLSVTPSVRPVPPPHHPALVCVAPYALLTAFFARLVRKRIVTRLLLKKLLYREFMYRVDTSHVRRRDKSKAKGSGNKCVVHPEHEEKCACDDEKSFYDEAMFNDDDSKTMIDHEDGDSGSSNEETGSSCSSFDYHGGSALAPSLTRNKFDSPALRGPVTRRGDVHLDLTKIHATGEDAFYSPFTKQTEAAVTRTRFSEPILKSARSRMSSLLFGRLVGSCDAENCNKNCDGKAETFGVEKLTRQSGDFSEHCEGSYSSDDQHNNIACQRCSECMSNHRSNLPQRSDSPLFVSSVNLDIVSPATSSSGSFIIDKSCNEHRVCHQCTPHSYEVQVPYYKIEYRRSGQDASSHEDETDITSCNEEESMTPRISDAFQDDINDGISQCESCNERISFVKEYEISTLGDGNIAENEPTWDLKISDQIRSVIEFEETMNPLCECCEKDISSCNGHKYLSPDNSREDEFVVENICDTKSSESHETQMIEANTSSSCALESKFNVENCCCCDEDFSNDEISGYENQCSSFPGHADDTEIPPCESGDTRRCSSDATNVTDKCYSGSTNPQTHVSPSSKNCNVERISMFEESLPIPLSMYENYDSLLCYRSSDIEENLDRQRISEKCPSSFEPFDGGTSGSVPESSAILVPDSSSLGVCDGSSNFDAKSSSSQETCAAVDDFPMNSISLCAIPNIRPASPFRDSIPIPMSPQSLRRPPRPFCDNISSSPDDSYLTDFPFDARPPSPFCDGNSASPDSEGDNALLVKKERNTFCDRDSASPELETDRVTCHYDMRPVTPLSPIRPVYEDGQGHSISVCDIVYTAAVGQSEHRTDAVDKQNEDFIERDPQMNNFFDHALENVTDEFSATLDDNESSRQILDIKISDGKIFNCELISHNKQVYKSSPDEYIACHSTGNEANDADITQTSRIPLEEDAVHTKPSNSSVNEFDCSVSLGTEEPYSDACIRNSFSSQISFARKHSVTKSCDPIVPFNRSFDTVPYAKEIHEIPFVTELQLEEEQSNSPDSPLPCKHNVQHQLCTCSVRSSDSGLADIAPASLSCVCTPHTSASSMHLAVTSQARTYRSEMYIHWWLKTKIPLASLTADENENSPPGRESEESSE